MATKKPENMTFEASIDELDQIVNQLENGELSLDDALKSFERGISLARASEGKLSSAEQRVAMLMGEGENTKLEAFQVEDEN